MLALQLEHRGIINSVQTPLTIYLSSTAINNDSTPLNTSYSTFAYDALGHSDTLLSSIDFPTKYNSENQHQNARSKSDSDLPNLPSTSQKKAFVRLEDVLLRKSLSKSRTLNLGKIQSVLVKNAQDHAISKDENVPRTGTLYSKGIATALVTRTNVSVSTAGNSVSTMSPGSNTSTTTSRTIVSTMATGSVSTMSTGSSNSTTTPHPLTPEGCPWNYDWCYNTPVIYLAQYLCASSFVSAGYPLCQVFSYIIFSKLLGPAPQVNPPFMFWYVCTILYEFRLAHV